MRLDSITPLIITRDEEPNIARSLERLAWAARIVVVDSFSEDRTMEILRGDPRIMVVQRAFTSFADQCNAGLAHVKTPWVLSLDADYICSADLAAELEAVPDETEASGFAARFRYCSHGRPLRGTLYPPRVVLHRRNGASYVSVGHAHRLQIDGAIGSLTSTIDHDDRKPFRTWLAAQRTYAANEAEKLRTGRAEEFDLADRLRRRAFVLPVVTPLYCLFYKGLILDGPAGWFYTAQRAYAETLVSLLLMRNAFRRGTS
ncbi:MAG: glycosyltransferase [Gemmatimonadetes bacterium]|nr:glycosyltransferase [Gemmatimonadota bacterium]